MRHRTIRSKGCLSNKTALAMVFKLVDAAQKSWRRLDGILPRPKRQIPIWLGGSSEAAFDRAARIGDGFQFGGRTQTEAVQIKAKIQAKLTALGRDHNAFGFESIQQYSPGDNQWPGDIAGWRVRASAASSSVADDHLLTTDPSPAG